jgi:hypothetical protein
VEQWTQNKRFIRTLESDTAALKGGTAPTFALPITGSALQKPPQEPLSQGEENANADTIDLDSAPAFDPMRLGAIPEAPATRPAERLISGSSIADIPALTAEMMPVAPARAPAPEPATPPLPDALAPIHTYTSDFNQAIKDEHASPATILAAEQDSGSSRKQAAAPARGVNTALSISAIVLILLGAGGAYAAYFYSSKPTTVAIAPTSSARIFVDETAQVSGTGSELAAAIMQSVATPLTTGDVRALTLAGTTTDSSLFLALMPDAPSILLRNVEAEGSVAGVVNANGNATPFFILAVDSYGDTFSGMLTWEPQMQAGLATLYPAASTTGNFADEVVDNHDTRVLKDADGNTVLLYGYWDQKTLIIAQDEDAFTELVSRLANSSTKQQ